MFLTSCLHACGNISTKQQWLSSLQPSRHITWCRVSWRPCMSADLGTADICLIELRYSGQHFDALLAALAGLAGSLQVREHEAEAFAVLDKPLVTCYLQRASKLSKSVV